MPKSRGNVSGFGLGNKPNTEPEKTSSKRSLDFGEEESARKRLEKLPTPPLEDADTKDDPTLAKDGDDDEDVELQIAGTEEEAAAAARAAAEKREERLQTQSTLDQAGETIEANGTEAAETNGDTVMTEAEGATQVPEPAEEQDDIDALDAFMLGLTDSGDAPRAPKGKQELKGRQMAQQPEALFGDDDVDLKTLDANPGDILAMASKGRKKKDLPSVNHSKMNYEPFRKKFYTEPAELASISEEELADLRLELDGIKIRVSLRPLSTY